MEEIKETNETEMNDVEAQNQGANEENQGVVEEPNNNNNMVDTITQNISLKLDNIVLKVQEQLMGIADEIHQRLNKEANENNSTNQVKERSIF